MSKWQEIRVFISSTFRDMHAERDYLVKVVFPKLRERLTPYRIHLIDIDLRWGITEEESQSDRVLDLCLEQIDKCRPYFVGILGERYGWVPDRYDEQALSKYGWIQHHTGKSVTELEILYGVLHKPEMRRHALFFFRDAAFIQQVPESKRADLLPEDDDTARKLRDLKQAIRDAGLPVAPMENYPCTYAGLRVSWRLASMDLDDTDRQDLHAIAEDGIIDRDEYASLDDRFRQFAHQYGNVHLIDLEAFGNRVFDDLWHAIKTEHELPDQPPTAILRETDPLAEEDELHRQFMEQRTRIYIGRQEIQRQLHAVADADDPHGCVVTGPAGSGKSAVMAKFAQDYQDQHADHLVIPHFVGASPGSTSLRQMLRRFCLILQNRYGFEDDVPLETNELTTTFREFITRVPADQRVVFIIDALNQLDETDNAHDLYWLPREWPGNVNCFVSCITHEDKNEPVLEAFKGRRNYHLKVEALTDEERFAIVTEVPSVSAKRLDPKQVRLLMENPATRNPLFLLVALEELRGFGSYEQLNRRIEQFPREGDTVTAIFTQVIERLEEEFDTRIVRQVLSLLACSRSGLSEEELLELIEGIGTETSSTDLFPVLRQIRPYLQHRGDLLDFYHRSFYKAARGYYLAPETRGPSGAEQSTHAQLAGYFHQKLNPPDANPYSVDHPHALADLVYHQVRANRRDEAEKTLFTYPFLQSKLDALGPQPLIEDYDLLNPARNEPLSLIQGAITLSSNVLGNDPTQLCSQLHGRLCDSQHQEIKALLKTAASAQQGPWIRSLTPTLTPPGGSLLRTLQGHTRPVSSVAISPNGNHAVSASWDTTLKIWDLDSGEILRTLEGHTSDVKALAVTPDGIRAVSASLDGKLKVWDLETCEILRTLQGRWGEDQAVAVTPDGKHAVSASQDKTLKVWDIESGQSLRTFEGHTAAVTSVAVTPDGKRVLSGSKDKTLNLWDLDSGDTLRTLQGHTNWVNGLAITPDGQRAVSASQDKTLKVWDIESGQTLQTLEGHTEAVTSVAVTPDGKRAVSASEDFTLKVWDLETGRILGALQGHTHFVASVGIVSDGRYAVSASWDYMLKVWNLDVGETLPTLQGHAGEIAAVVVTPDGKRALSASWDNTLKLWDIESGQILQTLEGHRNAVYSVAILPNGQHAVSASGDNTLKLWDIESGQPLKTLEGHTKGVTSVAITPDGKRALSASGDNTLKLWDIESGQTLKTLQGHLNEVRAVAITPDGRRAVSTSWDGTLKVWDLESGQTLRTLIGHSKGVTSIAVTSDGKRFVSASHDRTLKVWNLDSGETLRTVQGHTSDVSCVATTPDGKGALSASEDNTLKLWDLESSDCVVTFSGEFIGTRCTFSPDGATIIVGDYWGNVHFLRLENASTLPDRTL